MEQVEAHVAEDENWEASFVDFAQDSVKVAAAGAQDQLVSTDRPVTARQGNVGEGVTIAKIHKCRERFRVVGMPPEFEVVFHLRKAAWKIFDGDGRNDVQNGVGPVRCVWLSE